jgi:hypothetical protein
MRVRQSWMSTLNLQFVESVINAEMAGYESPWQFEAHIDSIDDS